MPRDTSFGGPILAVAVMLDSFADDLIYLSLREAGHTGHVGAADGRVLRKRYEALTEHVTTRQPFAGELVQFFQGLNLVGAAQVAPRPSRLAIDGGHRRPPRPFDCFDARRVPARSLPATAFSAFASRRTRAAFLATRLLVAI
jgi:hypothetical protein